VLAAVAYWLVEVPRPGCFGSSHQSRQAVTCGSGWPVSRDSSRALDQPLTAPDVKPRTMNCCRLKNTTMGSTMEMNAPAVSSS
jgi:hypothetical protein